MEAARKEAARDAVEVIKVAKASLDHGEQTLAIFCQKALRLASIEGRKLLRQPPPCLRLVIVSMIRLCTTKSVASQALLQSPAAGGKHIHGNKGVR